MPGEVVSAGDGWPAVEGRVGPALVVVGDPVWQSAVACTAVLVADAFGPLALHCLVEALHLAIPGRGEDVPDIVLGEQLGQRAVTAVAHRPVGHHSAERDALNSKGTIARSKKSVTVSAFSS